MSREWEWTREGVDVSGRSMRCLVTGSHRSIDSSYQADVTKGDQLTGLVDDRWLKELVPPLLSWRFFLSDGSTTMSDHAAENRRVDSTEPAPAVSPGEKEAQPNGSSTVE